MIEQVGDLIWVPTYSGETLSVTIVTETSEEGKTYTLILADQLVRFVGGTLFTGPEDLLITRAEEWTE